MSKTKWLIYTVAIGLLPVLIRILIFALNKDRTSNMLFSEIDFITFGLVLNITNINVLEENSTVDSNTKSTKIGISIILLILFAGFLFLVYFCDITGNQLLDRLVSKIIAAFLSIASFVQSFTIFDTLNSE